MIFDDFEGILHPWREQSDTGNDRNERLFMHFRTSAGDARVWPLQNRASYFLWSFFGEFLTFLKDFCIHDVSKAKAGTTKMTAFLCIFISLRRRAFLTIAKPEVTFFVLILSWIWMRFQSFLHDFSDPSERCSQVYEWSSEHVKMRNFHHFLKRFWPRKNRAPTIALRISWKKEIKFGREKVNHFGAIYI